MIAEFSQGEAICTLVMIAVFFIAGVAYSAVLKPRAENNPFLSRCLDLFFTVLGCLCAAYAAAVLIILIVAAVGA